MSRSAAKRASDAMYRSRPEYNEQRRAAFAAKYHDPQDPAFRARERERYQRWYQLHRAELLARRAAARAAAREAAQQEEGPA